MADDPNDDYDGPWKEALDYFFEQFLHFFFPAAHADIDWSRGVEFMDKEFQAFLRAGSFGRRYADKVAKVWLKNGEPQCIFVHVELQGRPERNFSERVYVYNYKIFDPHHLPVASLVVLMDESLGDWCVPEFGYRALGCEVRFTFPVARLGDFRNRLNELATYDNPIAILVLAHLKTQDTRDNDNQRLISKEEVVRILSKKGFSADTLWILRRLIDWLLTLPAEFDEIWSRKVEEIRKEATVPFVSVFEKLAIKEGVEKGMEKGLEKGLEKGVAALREAVVDILTERFGLVPSSISEPLKAISELSMLRRLAVDAGTVQTLAEFQARIPK